VATDVPEKWEITVNAAVERSRKDEERSILEKKRYEEQETTSQ